MSEPITFFVPGKPAPGGSKRQVFNKTSKRSFIIDACKDSKPWKTDVKHFAHEAYKGPLLLGPIKVRCTFYRARPKGHYGTGKNAGVLKASAPKYPTSKPDGSKLFRSTEDALTNVIWGDDAQVVTQTIKKRFSNTPGARIWIQEIAN